MFNLPERFKVDMKVPMKDFMPKDLKPTDKKRIRDAVKTVRLAYQITGEEIFSVVNGEYNCQVIQFYEIELASVKDAAFIASTYQTLIKPFCVIRLYDSVEEVFSLAIKRLNQIDETKVIVEDSLITEKYKLNVLDSARDRLSSYMDFSIIKNKSNKVSMYKEWYYKTYLLYNSKAYANVTAILDSNIWYDEGRTVNVMEKYVGLVAARDSMEKATTNVERMQVNKKIKKIISLLEEDIGGVHQKRNE